MKLYELTTAYQQLLDMLQDENADTECINDTLESLQGDIEEKAINIAKIIKSIDADIKAIKTEEERLMNKRNSLDVRKSNIKKYLESQLSACGIDKVKTPTMTVSLQNNPLSVKIIDESLIPKKYFITPAPQISKTLLMKQLKEGKKIPGCELQQTKSLRIR